MKKRCLALAIGLMGPALPVVAAPSTCWYREEGANQYDSFDCDVHNAGGGNFTLRGKDGSLLGVMTLRGNGTGNWEHKGSYLPINWRFDNANDIRVAFQNHHRGEWMAFRPTTTSGQTLQTVNGSRASAPSLQGRLTDTPFEF